MKHTFKPTGVCSTGIEFEIENNTIRNISFEGGCPGNLQAVSRLADGRPLTEIVKLLEGIKCGSKPTSCSDQLAKALKKHLPA
jgi:uncharacterized protein (TIGR03905 family)